MIAVLVAVLVFGSIGGVALANGGDEVSPFQSLMARVAEKLGIDEQVLRNAFADVHSEMQAERPEGLPPYGGPMAQGIPMIYACVAIYLAKASLKRYILSPHLPKHPTEQSPLVESRDTTK